MKRKIPVVEAAAEADSKTTESTDETSTGEGGRRQGTYAEEEYWEQRYSDNINHNWYVFLLSLSIKDYDIIWYYVIYSSFLLIALFNCLFVYLFICLLIFSIT
jgi:hypothetical protein